MPPCSGGRGSTDKPDRGVGAEQLGEQVKQGWGVVVAAQHHHWRDGRQLLEGGDTAGQVGVGGADEVEQIPAMNDQVGPVLPGVAEDLGQDSVVILAAGLVVGDTSQVPVGGV